MAFAAKEKPTTQFTSMTPFVCVAFAAGLVVSCIPSPDSQARHAGSSLALPKRFDATPAPVPNISSGLLSLFPDSRLRSYVNQALRSNPNLRASAARLEEAGFNTRKAYAPTLPSLTANVGSSRSRNPATSSTSDRYSASLDAQWELDVWGRIRAGVSASYSDQKAAAADHAAAKQSIAAQTMQAYFNLVLTEKLLGLSQRRLTSFNQTLKLVNRRFEAGTGNLGDVNLARTDVENTRAQVAQRK
ncbi:MAG: TolC family protein, partial [Akkermansiaceae bacterium]